MIHFVLPVLAIAAVWMLTEVASGKLRWPNARDRNSHGESRWANNLEARRLGRSVRPGREHGDGVVLGQFGRRILQTPAEDNCLVFGVQRSGKTSSVAVPTLLSWAGSVVATSTKNELVRLTARHRGTRGAVHVLAPLDVDTDWSALGATAVTWNPLDEIFTAYQAVELADLFTSAGKSGMSAHWYQSAATLLTGVILAEREQGGDLRSVLRRLNTAAVEEYSGIAGRVNNEVGQELLRAHAATQEREAQSIASTARSALSLWMDDRVARATAAGSDSRFDIDRFLRSGDTLYLVAPAEEALRCRPLFSALIQSILREATALARGGDGVLAPRLLFALDEIANFATIPHLSAHVSTGPGQGINWLLCFHDLAQLEAGYGPEAARTIWNNCRTRLLLPGQGDLKTLEHFSRAIGDETRTYRTAAPRGGDDHEQRVGRPLASPDFLRRSPDPILIYAGAPPARLRARRWDQVPAWRRLVTP